MSIRRRWSKVATGRLLLVLIATLVVLATAFGTSGRVNTSGDRTLAVATATDGNAYVGFEQTVERTAEATNLTITLTNQFPPGTTLTTVTVTVGSETRSLAPTGGLLTRERVTARFSGVDCTATITVAVSGTNTTGTLTRRVDC